ncbi:MAG: hypothetical protein KTR26_22095 [Flammeovirgaceae bacterium]|nr:hypothetical protein [Flammeovirgaceae bacterium]
MKTNFQFIYLPFILLFFLFSCESLKKKNKKEKESTNNQLSRIKIDQENPFYFTFNDSTVLLLGASNEDNLFQVDMFSAQLELMKSFGGNYVRCTMSSRDFGNPWPHEQQPNALYDLTKFRENYWSRFDKFLQLTAALEIVVQVEIWEPWDFYKATNAWKKNPFHPLSNNNYTVEDSGLPTLINYLPNEKTQPFFKTVPALDNNTKVLDFQQLFVDKLLSYSLKYHHVLYCINHESNASFEWGKYWAGYIKQKAEEEENEILVTDMIDNWDASDGEITNTQKPNQDEQPNTNSIPYKSFVENPETYDFSELSQNNIQTGEVHYATTLNFRNKLIKAGNPMPMTSIKVYGGELNDEIYGGFYDGPERFWRNIFAGQAAVRFHRPPAGLGMEKLAEVNIRSVRLLEKAFSFHRSKPLNDLLKDRTENEAFCLGIPGEAYALYYPGCGEVKIDIGDFYGKVKITWLDILNAKWDPSVFVEGQGEINLKSSCEGKWAVLVELVK